MISKYPDPKEIARRVIIEQVGIDGLTPSQIMSQVVFHSQSQHGVSISPAQMGAMPIERIAELIHNWCSGHSVGPEKCNAAIAYARRFYAER